MTGTNKYLPLIKEIYKSYKHATNFSRAAGGCKVVHVSEGKVKLEFEVTEELTNPFGTLHVRLQRGGCTSTLVDIATTTALLATPRQLPGVTVDLSVSCLSAAKLGETIVVDAEVIKAGKSIAFTKAQLYKKSDLTPIATALHTKAFGGQKKSDFEK